MRRALERLRSATPRECRTILAIVLLAGFAAHLLYLAVNCPIDLTGDEAHYWDWSRQLDVAYYSKGPLVAWIIRASCAVFGDHMWAVRLPALLLAVGTSLVTYRFVAKLFGSERLALATVLLTHTVPLFVAGSVVMTIDPPFFFCWACACELARMAIFDGRRGAWIGVGVAVGFGLLAKYAMPLWFVGLVIFLIVDRPSRRWLKTPWPWVALAIALAFFSLPLEWNARHGWVTFRHVGRQTGVTQTEGSTLLNPFEMIGTQAGVVDPIFFVFIVIAAVVALRGAISGDERRATRFLLVIGATFFAIVLLASLRTEIEPNWPAPSFFTLVPLAAWWLARQFRDEVAWRRVRGFFWTHVGIGIVATIIVHQSQWLIPLATTFHLPMKRADISAINKARGNAEYGAAVGTVLADHPDALVMARTYQDASQLAFYTPGHPRTFNISSYLRGKEQSRHSQFDVWPDRDLTNPALAGRDAILLGDLDADGLIRAAFESVKKVDEVPIVRYGVVVRSAKPIYLLRGFRGIQRPEAGSF